MVFYNSKDRDRNEKLFRYIEDKLLSSIGDVPKEYIDVSESSNNSKVIKYRINREEVPIFVIERGPRPLENFSDVNLYLERIIEIFKGKNKS